MLVSEHLTEESKATVTLFTLSKNVGDIVTRHLLSPLLSPLNLDGPTTLPISPLTPLLDGVVSHVPHPNTQGAARQ